MYKEDIVAAILEAHPDDFKIHRTDDVPCKARARRAVDEVFEAMALALESGDTVTISGFGTLVPVDRAPRHYNTFDGKSGVSEGFKSVKFKIASKLRKRLNC